MERVNLVRVRVGAALLLACGAVSLGGLWLTRSPADSSRTRISAIAGFPGALDHIRPASWWIAESQIQYFGPPARITEVDIRAFGHPLLGRAIVADNGKYTPSGVVAGALVSQPGYPSLWKFSPHTYARRAVLEDGHTYSLVVYFTIRRSDLVGGFSALRFTITNSDGSFARSFAVTAFECGGRLNGSWKCTSLLNDIPHYSTRWVSILDAPTNVGGAHGA